MKRHHLAASIAIAIASGLALAYASIGAPSPMHGSPTSTDTASTVQLPKDSPFSAAGRTKPSPPPPPLQLSIELPRYNKNKDPGVPLLHVEGSALVFKASFNTEPAGYFEDFSASGFLLEDPNGCLALEGVVLRTCILNSGNSFTRVNADVDKPNTENFGGDFDLADMLANDAVSGQPQFRTFNSVSHAWSVRGFGPQTGDDTVLDGVGYGTDEDLPGLVLLSPVGVGRVMTQEFNLPPTMELRNLAGFLSSVGWTPRNSMGASEITATINLPLNLLSPIVQYDFCISGTCYATGRYRVDGGPEQTYTFPADSETSFKGGLDDIYAGIFATRQFELTAFLVRGRAPASMQDMNGDGKVSAADATLAGFELLSNEVRLPYRLVNMPIRGCLNIRLGRLHGLAADMDGDGLADATGCNLGGGAGMLSQVPR